MLQANPANLPQSSRQQIMESIVNFETRVYEQTNLGLTDISPRNILIAHDNPDSLIFIDLASAISQPRNR